jgi:hypothetical protein
MCIAGTDSGPEKKKPTGHRYVEPQIRLKASLTHHSSSVARGHKALL